MRRVLITGVRGKTGAPTAEQLVSRGVEVRGGSGDPAGVRAAGVEPVRFSWDEPDGWPGVVDGVDGVLVVRPDRPDAPELVQRLVATTAGGTHVVLLSETAQGSYGDHDWAPRVEAAVRGSGRPWTVLRPGWFMQVFTDPRFFLHDLVEEGRLAFPGHDARLAWIDARDIAAVAVAALLEPGHDGRTHVLSGPQALTLAETADVLTAGAGRVVEHVDVDLEQALESATGFERVITEDTYLRVRRGEFAEVTGTVERVTGRPPRTLARFVADHAPFAPGVAVD